MMICGIFFFPLFPYSPITIHKLCLAVKSLKISYTPFLGCFYSLIYMNFDLKPNHLLVCLTNLISSLSLSKYSF